MNSSLRLLLPFLAVGALAASAVAKPKPPAPPPKPPMPTGPAYFFNIDLDPRYQIVGVGPVDPAQVPTSNCYCLTYDKDGKLQRVEFARAGKPMRDPFFDAPRIDIDYAPGVEHRFYHDGTGQAVANSNGVEEEELTLNNAGFPTVVINRNDSGGTMRDKSGVVRFDRTLDSQGRVTSTRRTGLLGVFIKDDDGNFETRSVYDGQNRIVEYGNYDSSGKLLTNEDGIATKRTAYEDTAQGNQTTVDYLDASGQLADDSSNGIHEVCSLTDPRGFLLSEAYFDRTGAPTVDATTGVHELRYSYDDRGNQTSEEFFGSDGQPKNSRLAGYARINYRYDDKNRISEKSYIGDDGLPQIPPNVGAAVIRQEYDDQGNITRRQFFDGQGKPSEHATYHAPAIRIKVDGDTTTVFLRDANDNPARNPINGFSSFSYKTAHDKPLSRTNLYYDQDGKLMSNFRVFVIKPHLYQLRQPQNKGMRRSARFGVLAAGIGALIAMFLAIRKSSYTKRRKIYVPTAFERLLGWFAVFALIEGTLRFLKTVYWAWVLYQNGNIGWYFNVIEAIVVFFFIYRLPRMRVTMRVLNISRDDIDKLVRDFFAKAQLKPDYIEARDAYRTEAFSVRVAYFANKAHAYLKLRYRHRKGRELVRGFAQYVRQQVGTMEAPLRSRAIALYYPCVALAYFALAFLAFYTFIQVSRG